MPDGKYPYAAALSKYLPPVEPPEPPKPRRGAGRPKALRTQSLAEFQQKETKDRHLGQLLKAIAEINSEHRAYTQDSAIAGKLVSRAAYKHRSVRTLRSDVSKAIQWKMATLKSIRPDLWVEILGIEPPPAMTKGALREKAFEALRHYLAQQQLLAKKP